jgi:hypothetical protein
MAAPSFADLSSQLGINTRSAAGANVAFEHTPQQMSSKPAPTPGFFTNVAKSAMAIPGQVAGAVANGVAKGFRDVAGGVSEALTSGRQNNANEQYRKAIEDAGTKYHQLYTSGKMSKAQYTKLSQGLIKQSQDLSGDINDQVSQMTSPGDFASGLATVGSLPFAFGSLTPEAGALGAATRVLGATDKTGSVAARILKAPAKSAVIDQPVAQAPVQIASDLKHGNIAGAAGNAALLAAPATLGVAGKVAKTIAPILKEAAFGKASVLTGALGDRVVGFIKNNPNLSPVLKQMEQFTLNQPAVKGDAKKGAEFLADHLKGIGVDPKTTDINEITNQFSAYAKNVQKLEKMKTVGKVQETAVVSHDFTRAIPKVADALKSMDGASASERVAATNKALDEAGITNQTVRDAINNGVHSGASVDDIKAMLVDQKQIIPGIKLDKGFIATYGPKERAALPTLKEATAAGAPELGKAANPVLGAFTGGLRKVGVGLENYDPKQIGIAKDNFTKVVDDLHLPLVDGKSAYNALSKLAEDKHLLDLRQLRAGEIEQSLGLSATDAKKVLTATKNMYNDVPLSVRGIAGKLQDANLKLNPLAAPYSRIQTRLRYDLNPAFRTQQKIEAATLGQVATGGHNPTGDVTKTLNIMRDSGFLPTDGSYAGEALRDTAGATNITTHLTLSEEKSLAHVLEATAAKNGRSVQDELKDEGTRQLMRAIVQNPKQGILSSNFAKAANMLFFPSAYNAKVMSVAIKALASQPPAVQFGVIKGINDFHDWAKTDAGVKWQRDNSELIGLISYFTPINSVQQIMSAVGDKNPRELGLIGGLPFGVIQRVLEGQGMAPKSTPPYLNPKTGEIVPDKIPQTVKAKLQQGIGDVLDTMFTFPGRQAGFGSKTDLRNTLTGGLLKPGAGETKSVTRTDLTPQQRNTQRVLAPISSSSISRPPTAATPSNRNIYTGKPVVVPVHTGGAKPKRGKTLAKRIGQPF